MVVTTAFEKEEQAIRKAKNSIYGLECSIFTQNVERAHQLARPMKSGTVWFNSSNDSNLRTPFEGIKQSGNGQELRRSRTGGVLQHQVDPCQLGRETVGRFLMCVKIK